MNGVLGLAVMLAVLLAGTVPPAHAVLTGVGPVDNSPTIGGYPKWYQDSTGIALEFCDPQNQAEVNGGWCLLLPGDVVIPENFPTNFFDEHFWFAAGANLTLGNGSRGLLVLAVEAAFAADVAPGGQMTFSRIRVRVDNVPATGTYRFIHPYGEESISANQGERIFFTDDVGINCPAGTFDCAIQSRLGPFLLPSNSPGGAELPPIPLLTAGADIFAPGAATPYPGNGKLYIADPARIGPVTGSRLPNFTDSTGALRNHNIFRIEGPAGSNLDGQGNNFIETANFSLMGRVFQGAIASRLTVDRASYARSATATTLDVFVTAPPATQARIPGGAPLAAITPLLQFYPAACAGVVDVNGDVRPPFSAPPGFSPVPMSSPGLMTPPQLAPASIYWGQTQPAVIPAAVCVEHQNAVNANNQIVPVFSPANVIDQVFITEAAYNPANGGSLSVRATSSDAVAPPLLTVAGFGDLVAGQFALAPLAAPPGKVRVFSAAGGVNEFQVTTGVGAGGGGVNTPVALNDAVTIAEDAPATQIAVLANDTLNGQPIVGGVVTIVTPPGLGVALVGANGVVNYTPNLNANGTDQFTYRVAVGGQNSNIAAANITITPVNDPPVAIADSFTAVRNVTSALDVLANDTDPDGNADITAPANVTLTGSPPGATVTLAASGRFVNFTSNTAGTHTFTYRARDAAGALSANTAAVTVTVAAAETVVIPLAEYRTTSDQWRISGTITPTTSGTVTITYANGPNAGFQVGTATITTGGAWSFRVTGVTGLNDPTVAAATQIKVTGPQGGTQTATINIRR